ncbi:hypothetical protein [Rhodoferax sp.]|uniref:hypothetical protein n=1 Tax=Rhodoferax sp. TaxID=50421 RepID=UPI0026206F07|nr:hypothetical protein [Rhodoferax sp.]MDD3936864.1 hypothetical protein [Rhodoferax sp.]
MTKVIPLASAHAGARVQLSAQSPSRTPTPNGIAPACGITLERQQAIENALAMALHFVRQPGDSAANLWAATARTNRALTLLKHASQGNAHGNALNALGRV